MQLSTVLRVHACFLGLLTAHWSAEGAEMYQRSHVAIAGGVVRLGDVVTCTGAAEAIAAPLLKLELFPAPSPDKTLLLTRQDLQQLLLLSDVDLSDWNFGGAKQTFIVHKKTAETIAAVDETASGMRDAHAAPAGATAIAPASIQQTPATSPPSQPAELTAAVAHMANLIPIVPNIPKVVGTLRPINRGDIVKASDVELISASDERTALRAYQNLDEVVGKEAKRLIPAGWPVDSSYVQKPVMVKRNEQVTIRAKAAGVTVTVRGFSKDDGAVGDVIAVTPIGTQDQILARVTGLRELEVFASGPKY